MSRNKQELQINLQLYLTQQQQNNLRSKNTFDINFFMPPRSLCHISRSICFNQLLSIDNFSACQKKKRHTYIDFYCYYSQQYESRYIYISTECTDRKKWTYVFQQLLTGSLLKTLKLPEDVWALNQEIPCNIRYT